MQPQEIISYVTWMSLDRSVRNKLVQLFDIPRSGETIVRSGIVMPDGSIGSETQSDGHTPQDLAALSKERMQEVLNTEDDNFYNLLKTVIDNLDDLLGIEIVEEELKEEAAEIVQEIVEEIREEEFVPRDPEELLKKKDITPSKTGKDAKAKTKKAKSK